MKKTGLSFITIMSAMHFAVAADSQPFLIYAPSRADRAVLTLTFTPGSKENSTNAELRLVETRDLGFSARTITQHPTKPILYISGGAAGERNLAIQYLDEKTNQTSRGVMGNFARDYSYLSVDKSKQYLLGCNYKDGIIDVYRLNEGGVPETEPITTLNEGRKAAHCVLTAPDNRHFYIPYVKENNALYQYSFDAKSGKVKALDPKNVNPPEDTGPRHLAYHPKLPFLYFSEEQGLGVSVYSRDLETGKLTFSSRARAADDDAPTEGVSASDIVITPGAKFLYTGIRGHKHEFDFIAGYSIQKDGSLDPLGMTATNKIPWGLAVSPDGHHLVVTSFGGGEIIVFRVNEDGSLKKVASLPVSEKISDVETRAMP